jgi:hypothetical protein
MERFPGRETGTIAKSSLSLTERQQMVFAFLLGHVDLLPQRLAPLPVVRVLVFWPVGGSRTIGARARQLGDDLAFSSQKPPSVLFAVTWPYSS